MFVIGEAVVDDAIGRVSFRCDLAVCKGACCCIAGGRGAPLADDEVQEIHRILPLVSRYLSDASLRTIETLGPVEGTSGDYATTCIDERECVFVTVVDGIALCAFERAYRDDAITWQKPLSCHLFPIRVSRSDPRVLRYEEIEECRGAREYGRREHTTLSEFLREPLIRRFGQAWYDAFRQACARRSLPVSNG